ncbi:MAG: efflux RND transporter periplasmic adaptor subunit [Janthinobacterium lividum]
MKYTTPSPTMALLVAATLALAGCGSKDEQQTPPPARIAVPVHVQQAGAGAGGPGGASGTAAQGLRYSGTVAEGTGVTVSFQVSGTITQLPIDAGQRVHKGQLLAVVDDAVYRDQYQAQLAQEKLAEDTYRRINQVYQEGSIAETRMVQARQQYEQAKAAARATYQNVAHTRLYAPIDGYIGTKQVDLGAVAGPGTAVASIVQLSQVKVNVGVPEAEINRLHKGDRATVQVSAVGNAPLAGRIDEVNPVADAQSHTFTVGVLVPNPGTRLKPSMTAQVTFDQAAAAGATAGGGSGAAALVLPIRAVQVDEHNRHFVYLVQGNAVRWHEVQTGDLVGNGLAVTGGLRPQDQVVVDGYQKLYDQAPVQVIR